MAKEDTPPEALRLQEARKKRGYSSATAAAEAFGWSAPTYLAHENGTRGITPDAARKYGKAFGRCPAWILFGADEPLALTVPVVGYIGAGAEIFHVDDHAMGAGLQEVEAPPGCGPETVAVVVRGDSQWPILNDGDVLFYSRHLPPMDLIQKRAVVGIADGRRFVKTLVPGSKRGFFTLTSANAAPIIDVKVDWAAPIDWIRPK